MNGQLEPNTFLSVFFGPGNEIQWAEARSPSHPLRFWVQRICQKPWRPTVLPRRAQGKDTWYGIAPDPQQLRALASLVMAFVGPSYSTFRGELPEPENRDDFDVAVNEFTSGCYFSFIPAKGAWKALCRMEQVLARWPLRPEIEYRGPDRLLRDFDTSLTTRDRAAAETVLRELTVGGHFDSLNLTFLRARLLGEFGAFDELLNLPEIPELLMVRRPRIVTTFLLEAVYSRELARFEAQADVVGAVRRFRQGVESAYPTLWQVRTGFDSPGALKILMVVAVAGAEPDAATRDRILAVAVGLDPLDAHWLRALAGVLPLTPTPPNLTIEAAEAAAAGSDFDLAWEISCKLPPSVRCGFVLMRSALEIDTIGVRRAALDALQTYPEEIRSALRGQKLACRLWRDLEGESEPSTAAPAPSNAAPNSWIEWFDALFSGTPTEKLIRTARIGEPEWDFRSVLRAESGVRQIVTFFSRNKSAEQELALATVIPLLCRTLDRLPPEERPLCKLLYECIRERLLQSEAISVRDLELHNDTLRTLFVIGVSAEECTLYINDALDVWACSESPRYFEWVLDLFDLLVQERPLDSATRTRTPAAIQPALLRHRSRLDTGLLMLFNQLCIEVGQPDLALAPIGEELKAETASWLESKSILLYTLQPGVAERVRHMIEAAAADVTVHISSDHTGTDHLRSICRMADVVVLATRAAKHSATEFIERQMRPGTIKLMPAGKGAVSMWRVLRDYRAP